MMSGIKRNNDRTARRNMPYLQFLQKLELIKKLEYGSCVKFLATEFGIGDCTVHDIKIHK